MTDQLGLPTIDALTCACGAGASWESQDAWGSARTHLANGRFCLDCEKFFCSDCQANAVHSDENADNELCPTCNGTWNAAGFGAR